MPVYVRVTVNDSFIKRLLRSPFGPVGRDMHKRGERVAAAARRNVNSRTGALARSIVVDSVVHEGAGVRVGTSLHYAKFVHDGTGIYGPLGRPLRAPRNKPFRFDGRSGEVFTQSFVGQRGTKFLERALHAAR